MLKEGTFQYEHQHIHCKPKSQQVALGSKAYTLQKKSYFIFFILETFVKESSIKKISLRSKLNFS